MNRQIIGAAALAALVLTAPAATAADIVHDIPYQGIENLRPETQELLRIFTMGMPTK